MDTNHSVLVVDDDPLCRNVVRFVLELEMAISPLLARNAREALGLLAVNPVDILITDLRMPDLNGMELITKAQAFRPELSSILMSGDFSPDLVELQPLIASGSVTLLHKDELLSTLTAVVQDLIDEKQQRLESSGQSEE